MQTLQLDPPVPFLLPAGPITIALVGCGGTGSHIAQALARIAAHTRHGREQLRLVFLDGDHVEEKNVGRQLFGPGDVGQNKAIALAARFNHLFGLAIEAIPAMATQTLLQEIRTDGQRVRASIRPAGVGLLIGAVDSAAGRRVLATTLSASKHWQLWLDSGNHEASGQVVIGSETEAEGLADAIKLGLCTKLPAPSLVYPELLGRTVQRRQDCAEAVEQNIQALMVNQMMGAIVAEYLAQIVLHRRLTAFQTTVDLRTLSMRSTPITASAIAAIRQAGAAAPAPTKKVKAAA